MINLNQCMDLALINHVLLISTDPVLSSCQLLLFYSVSELLQAKNCVLMRFIAWRARLHWNLGIYTGFQYTHVTMLISLFHRWLFQNNLTRVKLLARWDPCCPVDKYSFITLLYRVHMFFLVLCKDNKFLGSQTVFLFYILLYFKQVHWVTMACIAKIITNREFKLLH